MSAPHTNIEKQKRRHRGPLIGMIVVVVFAFGLIGYWLLEEAAQSDPPEGAATQIDGRTGAAVEDSAAEAPVSTAPDPAPTDQLPVDPQPAEPASPLDVPAAPQTAPPQQP